MTQNLYYGADLGPAIGAVMGGDPDEMVAAVSEVWANVVATDFPTRARALADEILARGEGVDLLAVQEAALWRSQAPSDAFSDQPTPATTVEYDFLEILVAALADVGLAYDVIAVNEGFDIELPRFDVENGLVDVRLTDRVALLARHDMERLSNPQHGSFTTNLPLFPGFDVVQGWASVDVVSNGHSFRFVTAHLDADSPDVATAQAAELLAGPLAEGDAVFAGDVNSDADGGPDATPAYPLLLSGGFGDAWLPQELDDPSVDGSTWGHDPLLLDPASSLHERIDVVLVRGVASPLAWLMGTDPLAMALHGGLWASDHAGLEVALEP
jgi:endonuclease/exonuclease/phosphatase family metal-dependent hydrolase